MVEVYGEVRQSVTTGFAIEKVAFVDRHRPVTVVLES